MAGIEIRAAVPEDAEVIARLHAEALPEYFLTHLGPAFLRRYYRAFLQAPHTVVVGSIDRDPVGFVAGTTDLGAFRRHLYPPNLLPFAWIVVRRTVADRTVRREVVARLHHVRLALRALFSRLRRRDDELAEAGPTLASLFSIAVAPHAQGSGVADAIITKYLAIEASKGATRSQLSVNDDNARALAFYERRGWAETDRDGHSVVYEVDLTA